MDIRSRLSQSPKAWRKVSRKTPRRCWRDGAEAGRQMPTCRRKVILSVGTRFPATRPVSEESPAGVRRAVCQPPGRASPRPVARANRVRLLRHASGFHLGGNHGRRRCLRWQKCARRLLVNGLTARAARKPMRSATKPMLKGYVVVIEKGDGKGQGQPGAKAR